MNLRIVQEVSIICMVIVALCEPAVSKHYYIVPLDSSNSACGNYQNQTCLTLKQITQSNLTILGRTNLTLSFLSGIHILTESLAIHNFLHVQMWGENSTSVSFHGRGRIEILHSKSLSIQNIGFILNTMSVVAASSFDQQLLGVHAVERIYIDSCDFVGIENEALNTCNNLSTVKISNSRNTTIDNVIFNSNCGEVMKIESHDVTIYGIKFTRNAGSGIYINSTNTVISDCNIEGNTGRVLTIVSDSTVMTLCNVSSNTNSLTDCERSGIMTLSPSISFTNTTSACSLQNSCNRNVETYKIAETDSYISNTSVTSHIDPQLESTVFITSCIFTNNTSYRGTLSIASGCSKTQHYQLDEVHIMSCVFTNNTGYQNGGAFSIASLSEGEVNVHLGNVLIISSIFSKNANIAGDGGAFSIASGHKSNISVNLRNINITSCIFNDNTNSGQGGAFSIVSGKGAKKYSKAKAGNIFITSCIFDNHTTNIDSAQNGGVVSIASGIDGYWNVSLGNVLITLCTFRKIKCTQRNGGAVSIASGNQGYWNVTLGNVLITLCTFTKIKVDTGHGGAFISASSDSQNGIINVDTVHIANCTFSNNYYSTGVLSIGSFHAIANLQNVLITTCSFINNTCIAGGVVSVGTGHAEISLKNMIISFCTFTNNYAMGGGTIFISMYEKGRIRAHSGNVLIISSIFTNNRCNDAGSALNIEVSQIHHLNLNISSCIFVNNTSSSHAYTGGAIHILINNLLSKTRACATVPNHPCTRGLHVSISHTYFRGNFANIGGAIFFQDKEMVSSLTLLNCSFTNTSFMGISLVGIRNVTFINSTFTHNANSIATLKYSTVTFLSGNCFSSNNGSVYAFKSNLHFEGATTFRKNYYSSVIYALQSQIHLSSPDITITNNQASFGGGIYLSESTMVASHPIRILKNTADYGGGIYSYLSSIEFISEKVNKIHMYSITGNRAKQDGGGICAIASIIKISKLFVDINSNTANNGGGMYISQGSKIYLLKLQSEKNSNHVDVKLIIQRNLAQYGGGVFVEDKTTEQTMCMGKSFAMGSSRSASVSSTECFLQTINAVDFAAHSGIILIRNTYIIYNTATISGSAIYGGLFDRCTLNPFSETVGIASNGLDYLHKTVGFLNDHEYTWRFGSSEKHFCDITPINCSNNTKLYSYVSSQPVRVVFCDKYQQASVYIKKGELHTIHVLALDQIGKPVNATIHSSISGVSRLKEGQIKQTVGNQCTALEYNIFSLESSVQLELYADGPCTNLGMSKQVINITFLPCKCVIGLQPSSKKDDCECVCDPRLQPYQITNCSQETGTIELEKNIWIEGITNGAGYIIHDCPFDYCVEKPVNISLNSYRGRDRQCAFNRSGVLCGGCRQGFSLVFGTSKCDECSSIYLLLVIPFALAGIALVGFIFLLNITIATGTVHGLIFYSNILAANKAIFLPFTAPNFLTVLISWVNLDLGIETCFYNEMNSQAKVLLQLVFPAYLFLLMFLIIICSRYSNFFSSLLSNRNPVAALCTLILLSYSKLLRFTISALQGTILSYPDGSHEKVWLYDANVPYFIPGHIPRFVAAVSILTTGGLFTVILFYSQWFPHCSNWKIMKWTRNTKYTGFIDAYHAPFTPKHRYWVGLLLFALIVQNIVVATASTNFLSVVSAGSLSVGLITLKLLFKKVYKDWSKDSLETLFLLNLAIFAIGTLYIGGETRQQRDLSFVSMAISFTLFMIIISHHFINYVLKHTRMWFKLRMTMAHLRNNIAELQFRLGNNRQCMYQEIKSTTEDDDDEVFQAEDTIPAIRTDQLREPALDMLAPITSNDYRPASSPATTKRQEVTHSVVRVRKSSIV